MIIQGDNIIVNGNTTSGANIAKFDDYISVDANNRVSTTDMIATQSFRIGDDAHWKIRPNNSNQELCFEYGASNVMNDANIKAKFNSSGHFLNPNQPAWSVDSVFSDGTTPTAGSFANGYTTSNSSSPAGKFVRGVSISTPNSYIRVTVPVSGVYHCTFKRHVKIESSSGWTEFRYYLNGFNVSTGHQGHEANSAYETQMHAVTLYANANDYIEFVDGGGTPVSIHGPSTFSGFLIG